MPEISVIVPVYKVEPYLHQCVDSILAQTFTDFELILVDDGSPDSCGAICDEYAAKDDRVHVIHQHNGGLSAARNAGIKKGRGKFFCFVDSDDLIHYKCLERLYSAAINYESDISLCYAIEASNCPESFWVENEQKKEDVVDSNDEGIYRLLLVPWAEFVAWGKLVRADIVKANPFEKGRLYEDTITLKWLCESNRIAVLHAQLYFYRVNPAGISKSSITVKKAIDGVWAISERLNWMREYGYNKLEKHYLSRFLYESAKAFFIVQEEDKRLANKIKKRALKEWVKNGRGIQFKKGEKAFFFEMIAPHIMWVYWKIKRN